MKRITLFLVFMLVLFFLATSRMAVAEHRYLLGVVTKISYDAITVDSQEFTIDRKAKVLECRNDGGVVIEEKVQRTKIIPGKKVTLRLDDDVVTEIIISSY